MRHHTRIFSLPQYSVQEKLVLSFIVKYHTNNSLSLCLISIQRHLTSKDDWKGGKIDFNCKMFSDSFVGWSHKHAFVHLSRQSTLWRWWKGISKRAGFPSTTYPIISVTTSSLAFQLWGLLYPRSLTYDRRVSAHCVLSFHSLIES